MTSNQLAWLEYTRKQGQEGAKLAEERRANLVKEVETNRSNVVKEIETQRHNVQEEKIGKMNVAVKAADTFVKGLGTIGKLLLPLFA